MIYVDFKRTLKDTSACYNNQELSYQTEIQLAGFLLFVKYGYDS